MASTQATAPPYSESVKSGSEAPPVAPTRHMLRWGALVSVLLCLSAVAVYFVSSQGPEAFRWFSDRGQSSQKLDTPPPLDVKKTDAQVSPGPKDIKAQSPTAVKAEEEIKHTQEGQSQSPVAGEQQKPHGKPLVMATSVEPKKKPEIAEEITKDKEKEKKDLAKTIEDKLQEQGIAGIKVTIDKKNNVILEGKLKNNLTKKKIIQIAKAASANHPVDYSKLTIIEPPVKRKSPPKPQKRQVIREETPKVAEIPTKPLPPKLDQIIAPAAPKGASGRLQPPKSAPIGASTEKGVVPQRALPPKLD